MAPFLSLALLGIGLIQSTHALTGVEEFIILEVVKNGLELSVLAAVKYVWRGFAYNLQTVSIRDPRKSHSEGHREIAEKLKLDIYQLTFQCENMCECSIFLTSKPFAEENVPDEVSKDGQIVPKKSYPPRFPLVLSEFKCPGPGKLEKSKIIPYANYNCKIVYDVGQGLHRCKTKWTIDPVSQPNGHVQENLDRSATENKPFKLDLLEQHNEEMDENEKESVVNVQVIDIDKKTA